MAAWPMQWAGAAWRGGPCSGALPGGAPVSITVLPFFLSPPPIAADRPRRKFVILAFRRASDRTERREGGRRRRNSIFAPVLSRHARPTDRHQLPHSSQKAHFVIQTRALPQISPAYFKEQKRHDLVARGMIFIFLLFRKPPSAMTRPISD